MSKTKNIGEISELYTIFKLAADGKLQHANVNFDEIPDAFTEIKEIIRTGSDGMLSIVLEEDDTIRILLDNVEKAKVSIGYMANLANITYSKMLSSEKEYSEAEEFLSMVGCKQVKANSTTKADLSLKVYDIRTGSDPVVKYSIKSDVGSRSTLYNATSGAMITYEIKGGMTDALMEMINNFTNYGPVEDSEKASKTSGKVKKKFVYMLDKGMTLDFIKEDIPFHNNLMFVDTQFPKIFADMVLKYYSTKALHKVDEITDTIEKENPLHVSESIRSTYYEFKVKTFLVMVALGMTQGTLWDVRESVTGGIITVKRTGKLVCYHLFDRNEFEDHLFHLTSIDTPSTGRHSDSLIRKTDDGKYVISVACQIRLEQTKGEMFGMGGGVAY